MIYKNKYKLFLGIHNFCYGLSFIIYFIYSFYLIFLGLSKMNGEGLIDIFIWSPIFGAFSALFFYSWEIIKDLDVYLHNYQRLTKNIPLENGIKYSQNEIDRLLNERISKDN